MEPFALREEKARQLVGMGRTAFLAKVYSGDIPSFKVGAMRLIPVEGLRAWVERQAAAASQGAQTSPDER